MASDGRAARTLENVAELTPNFRRSVIGIALAAIGALIQLASFSALTTALGITFGVVGVIVAASAIVCRPTDSRVFALGAIAALTGNCRHSSTHRSGRSPSPWIATMSGDVLSASCGKSSIVSTPS